MPKNVFILFTLLVFLSYPTSGQEKIMVCKDIQKTGNDCVSNKSLTSAVQGPPGKKGPRGVQGMPGVPGMQGVPGIPATVDYNRISNMTEAKIREGLVEINLKVASLQGKVTELIESSGKHERCRNENGFIYDGRCYTVPHVSSAYNLNYDQAVRKCSSRGALLAEIHSLAHQHAIHDFVRTRLPASTSGMNLWIGMLYQHSNKNLRFRSGKEISVDQFKWHAGYPSGSYNKMGIGIRLKDHDEWRGLYDWNPASNRQGVICEKPL